MGIDAGFDMVPRLSTGAADQRKWTEFIRMVQDHYCDDKQVECAQNYILFKAGEHPKLPFQGHKFLRFSSKVSGSIAAATGVESYIDTVTTLAKAYFSSRVRYWNEAADQDGFYDWNEVRESESSYDQAVETGTCDETLGPIKMRPCNEVNDLLFEVMNIKGKGRGLIARSDISIGTCILKEKPLLTARSTSLSDLEAALVSKLRSLPKASQRQFLSLHNHRPGRYPFSHTFKTNALPCGSRSPVGAVYPTICLINHSCIPNSHNNWDSRAEHETIYAIRPIQAGEEVTIAYDRGGPAGERQSFLQEAFGFDCMCDSCSCSVSDSEASDSRRRQIEELDTTIGDPYLMQTDPKKALIACLSLLATLDKEYGGFAGALNARVYYDALQISIAHGDQARASVFAERAYKARVICEGEDNPETQRVKSFGLRPASHRNFEGCSRAWRTTKKLVPQSLDAMEFEKWLFREKHG